MGEPENEWIEALVARMPRIECKVEIRATELESFRERGFTQVPRITSDEELEWLRELYDGLFAERTQAVPGGYFDLSRPYDAAGQDLQPQLLGPEVRIPALRETALFRNGRRLAATLLGVEERLVRGWGHMIQKAARIGTPLPWHQDEAYWDPAYEYRALGCWMPLDDVNLENGCLAFLPGSHRGPVRKHRHVGDDPRVHALQTDDVDGTGAVHVPLCAGEATFHDQRTLHSSGPNRSPRVRRAYANEFQTPPVKRAVPEKRIWIDEGQKAWDARAPEDVAGARGDGKRAGF